MERRHQVFISSTFSDLKHERAEIVQALLELDCFPAGMELFPATTEGAWDLIKGVIDDSDYYCLVLGGRYGSLDSSGLSYTEKEYDYAVFARKPIVAFLHGDTGSLAVDRSEKTSNGQEKLKSFRAKIETNHHCKYWSTAEELGGKVSRGIVALRKAHPSDGWVPGAFAADESSRVEMANLRARIAELETELAKKSVEDTASGNSNLASGDDILVADIYVATTKNAAGWRQVNVSWDSILGYLGPTLLPECSDDEFREKLNLCFSHALEEVLEAGDNVLYESTVAPHVLVDKIKIQFRALGYMVPGVKRRAVSDRKTYWKLSQVGEKRLLAVQAIQKIVREEQPIKGDDKRGRG